MWMCVRSMSWWSFNSRTRKGCDYLVPHPAPPEEEFQFTHPQGVRLSLACSYLALALFQFTHPQGVRPKAVLGDNGITEFQFTHPQGVRHETGG